MHPTEPTSDEFQYELELMTEDDQVFQMWNICLVNMVGFGAITRTGAFVRGGAGAAGRGGKTGVILLREAPKCPAE